MVNNKADVLVYLRDNGINANYIGSLLDTDKRGQTPNTVEMLVSVEPHEIRIHYISIEDFCEMVNDRDQYRVLDMWFDALALKYGLPIALSEDRVFEADYPMSEENKTVFFERYGGERLEDGSYRIVATQKESFIEALARYFEQLPPNRFLELIMMRENLNREKINGGNYTEPTALNRWGTVFEYMLRLGFNSSFTYKPKTREDSDNGDHLF